MALYVTANPTQLGSADPTASSSALTTLVATATLTDTCAILSQPVSEATSDGQGTNFIPWFTVALDVPCSLEKPSKDTEKVVGGTLMSSEQFLLKVPVGTDLQPSFSIVKGGQIYGVVDTDSGLSNPLYLSAVVVRLWNWPVS